MLVFDKGKSGVPGEKLLRGKERTDYKVNPHMTLGSGIKPETNSWEASALTTVPFPAP